MLENATVFDVAAGTSADQAQDILPGGKYATNTLAPAPCQDIEQTSKFPIRILLVEDDEDMRDLLALALGVEGFAVIQVPSAEDGLAELRRRRFDLVLTDYALPRKTGTTMLEEASSEGLLTLERALIITAHPQPRPLPGVEIIYKPIDLDSLLNKICLRLRGGPTL